jgi:hypothetical protein
MRVSLRLICFFWAVAASPSAVFTHASAALLLLHLVQVISDLLKPERTNLIIREDKKRGVYVEGLSEWVVRSPAEIYGLMERGGLMRATGSTKMNEISSRSHAVFMIITEQSETTYLDDAGHELSVEEFHRLVKSRAHGDSGLKQLESNVRQSFKVGPTFSSSLLPVPPPRPLH